MRPGRFREKNPVLPIEKFVSCTSQKTIIQHLISIRFSLHYLSSGRLRVRRLKTNENVKLLALKVVAVANMRWPRGSKYSDFTGKHLLFGKTGH